MIRLAFYRNSERFSLFENFQSDPAAPQLRYYPAEGNFDSIRRHGRVDRLVR